MTATCHRADHDWYIDRVGGETERLLAAARQADSAAPIPTCPGWTVSDLLDHIGTVHRWMTAQVQVLTPTRIPSAQIDLGKQDDTGKLAERVADGVEPMVVALRSQDPDAEMWGWGSDKHVRFWSRRMVHETTIHRTDAEFAAGLEPAMDPAIAVDGIDEFLDNIPHAAYFAPTVKELRGDGERLLLRCDAAAWTITLGPAGFVWSHQDDGADATVEASPTDLNLFVWGRRKISETDRIKTSGDAALLSHWITNSSI